MLPQLNVLTHVEIVAAWVGSGSGGVLLQLAHYVGVIVAPRRRAPQPLCLLALESLRLSALANFVGVTGFEPATLCSQSRCATKLRYTP